MRKCIESSLLDKCEKLKATVEANDTNAIVKEARSRLPRFLSRQDEMLLLYLLEINENIRPFSVSACHFFRLKRATIFQVIASIH